MGFEHAGGVEDFIVFRKPAFGFPFGAKFESRGSDTAFSVVSRSTDHKIVCDFVGIGEGEFDLFAGKDVEALFVVVELSGDSGDEDVAGIALGVLRDGAAGFSFGEDPDVAELDGVAVILKVKRAEGGFLVEGCGGSGLGDFDIILHEDAVEEHGHAGVGSFVAFLVEAGSSEVDVVGLPAEGREAHVELGFGSPVNASGVSFVKIGAEGIEDLNFVSTLKIDAAVATALSAFERSVGGAEFEVEVMVSKGEMADGAFGQVTEMIDMAVLKGSGIEAVVKKDGIDGSFLTEGLGLSFNTFEFAIVIGAANSLVFENPWVIVSPKNDLPVALGAVVFTLGESASGAGKASLVVGGAKFVVTKRGDLEAMDESVDLSCVFALGLEIRVVLGGGFGSEVGLSQAGM